MLRAGQTKHIVNPSPPGTGKEEKEKEGIERENKSGRKREAMEEDPDEGKEEMARSIG